MGTYSTSTGERFTQSQIDRRITKAKAQVVQNQFDEHGYNFCEECGRSTGMPLDCSHDISVKKAKDEGRAEECWNIKNIVMRCRKCHQQKDGLDLKFTQ